MLKIRRLLRIELPKRQSAFLWGPRETGKSTFLRDAFPASLTFDFLKTDLALNGRELRPLAAFADEQKPKAALAVTLEREERAIGGVKILPWRLFLEKLWSGQIISQDQKISLLIVHLSARTLPLLKTL